MAIWTYRTWSAARLRVEAASMTFEPGHVAWWDSEGALVFAERNENVAGLRQENAHGTVGNDS